MIDVMRVQCEHQWRMFYASKFGRHRRHSFLQVSILLRARRIILSSYKFQRTPLLLEFTQQLFCVFVSECILIVPFLGLLDSALAVRGERRTRENDDRSPEYSEWAGMRVCPWQDRMYQPAIQA